MNNLNVLDNFHAALDGLNQVGTLKGEISLFSTLLTLLPVYNNYYMDIRKASPITRNILCTINEDYTNHAYVQMFGINKHHLEEALSIMETISCEDN